MIEFQFQKVRDLKVLNRRFSVKRLGITFLVILGLLMGGQTGAIAAEGITASGFLDDYDLLKPDARVFGTYIYRSEDVSPGKYNKMIIAPVEIWLDPKSHRGVNPASLKELVDGMKDVFVQTLSGTVEFTDEPGTGVMVLRMAITNVNARTPKRMELRDTPRGSFTVIKNVQDAAAKDYFLKKAVLEAEVYDSETFRVLATFIDIRLGLDSMGKQDDTRSWEDVTKDLTFYSERFKENFQAVFGEK